MRKRNETSADKRRWNIKTRYGMTEAQLSALRADQHGLCAICGRELAGHRECVDHNHESGEVRGLLCHRCNVGLSFMENEKLRNMATKYLGLPEVLLYPCGWDIEEFYPEEDGEDADPR